MNIFQIYLKYQIQKIKVKFNKKGKNEKKSFKS